MSFEAAIPILPRAATRKSVPARGDGPTAAKMDGMFAGLEFDATAVTCYAVCVIERRSLKSTHRQFRRHTE